jgi:hypothetical protein
MVYVQAKYFWTCLVNLLNLCCCPPARSAVPRFRSRRHGLAGTGCNDSRVARAGLQEALLVVGCGRRQGLVLEFTRNHGVGLKTCSLRMKPTRRGRAAAPWIRLCKTAQFPPYCKLWRKCPAEHDCMSRSTKAIFNKYLYSNSKISKICFG